jgi:hypothetical protein
MEWHISQVSTFGINGIAIRKCALQLQYGGREIRGRVLL